MCQSREEEAGAAGDVDRLEMQELAMLRSRQRSRKPSPAHRALESLSRAASRPPEHPEEPCQLPEAKDHTSALESRAVPRHK